MADGFSVLSNFQVNSAASSNAVKLICDLGDVGNGITLSPVKRTAAGNNLNFEQTLSGSGSMFGTAIPDSLFPGFGLHTTIFVQMLADVPEYLDAETDAPKVSASMSCGIYPITGSSLDVINLLAEFNRLNIAPYYINTKIINRNVYPSVIGGTPQCNLQINRSRTYFQPIDDVPEFYAVSYIKLDENLNDLLHTTWPGGYPSQNWINPTWEIKTGMYNNFYGLGDFRTGFVIVKKSTGLFYVSYADINAGATKAQIPCLPSGSEFGTPNNPYWVLDSSVASPGVLAPGYQAEAGKWVKWEWYCRRAKNFNDLTTGRTWLALTPMDTMIRTVVFDKVGGVHMGCANLPITRMFLSDAYSGAPDGPYENNIAGIRIWNKCPFIQA